MLVELQHLKSVIHSLSAELTALRKKNQHLQHNTLPLPLMPESTPSAETDELKQQLLEEQEHYQTLNMRHNTLVLAHEGLKLDLERLGSELKHLQEQVQTLAKQKTDLQQKNKYAKQKVAAIMQRLHALDEPNDDRAE